MTASVHDRLLELWAAERPSAGQRVLGAVLTAPSLAFGFASGLRGFAFDRGWLQPLRSSIPVISIGGLEVGGVGKTPLVAELVRAARLVGLEPAILTRGFGGGEWSTPRCVPREPAPTAALDFGDEPIQLRQQVGPSTAIWVSRHRTKSARAAAAGGASVLLLDDGFQHRQLARDADVVCLSSRRPFANGRLLPAGPLRESPSALRRATRIVVGDVNPAAWPAIRDSLLRVLSHGPTLHAWSARPSLRAVRGLPCEPGASVTLLTGVAHPERVARTAELLGLRIAEHRADPDHHAWTGDALRSLAREIGDRPLVTTEKSVVPRVAYREPRYCPFVRAGGTCPPVMYVNPLCTRYWSWKAYSALSPVVAGTE